MVRMQARRGQRIDSIEASAYTIPTDLPEADGTLSWTSTTLVVVEAHSGATRCAGITGFLRAAMLCGARSMPLSAHMAPAIHVHPCCAAPAVRHLEWFHDHVRIERMLFDGAPVLALTGQTYHDLLEMRYQQEVNLLSLFTDVAVFDQQVTGGAQIDSLVDAACRTALSDRGVAHITCPLDLQGEKVGDDTRAEALLHGEPNRGRGALTLFRDKVHELF